MMNLTELFEVQRKLDAEIERKHPAEPGEDRLAKRILALQVELGELANEWRGFKFWSNRQTPNTLYQTTCQQSEATHYYCDNCKKEFGLGEGVAHSHECEWMLYPMKAKNPLLEEYVDCLHFILSIGLEVDESYFYIMPHKGAQIDIVSQFSTTLKYAALIAEDDYCSELLTSFYQLGEMLGFTWEQVTEAYMSKNKINHERQANGY